MSNACVLFFQSLPLFWVRLYWKRFGIFTDQMAVASFPCENIKVSSLEIEFMINSKYKCIDHPVSMPQNINNQKWISLTDLQWITWIITCKTCSWSYFCNFTQRYFLDKKYLTLTVVTMFWTCKMKALTLRRAIWIFVHELYISRIFLQSEGR